MPPTGKNPKSYTRFSSKLSDSISEISKTIEENAKMIDLVQDIAIELTDSIATLHKITVKYATKANAILDILLPIAGKLPLVPKNLKTMLTNLESFTQKIVDDQAKTRKTISDVTVGLKTGDVSKLQMHSGELQNLTKTLKGILPG